MTDHPPRLISLSPGAGCACKLPLAKLEEMFAAMDPVGPASGDLLIGALAVLLHDAQTSGGLLLAAPGRVAAALLADLRARGLPAALIGEVVAGEPGHIDVHRAHSG